MPRAILLVSVLVATFCCLDMASANNSTAANSSTTSAPTTVDDGPMFTVPQNLTEFCPLDDKAACEALAGACEFELGYYLQLVQQPNAAENPDILDCFGSICCYCDEGSSDLPVCTTPVEFDLGDGPRPFRINFLCSFAPLLYDITFDCDAMTTTVTTTEVAATASDTAKVAFLLDLDYDTLNQTAVKQQVVEMFVMQLGFQVADILSIELSRGSVQVDVELASSELAEQFSTALATDTLTVGDVEVMTTASSSATAAPTTTTTRTLNLGM